MEVARIELGGADEAPEALRLPTVDLTLVDAEECLRLLRDERALAFWHHDLHVIKYDSTNPRQLAILETGLQQDAVSSSIAIVLDVLFDRFLIHAHRYFVILELHESFILTVFVVDLFEKAVLGLLVKAEE